MAVEELHIGPAEISQAPSFRSSEDIVASAPTNVSGALEAHAESLEEYAEQLDQQAVAMRARARRIRDLAEAARKEGHFGVPVRADVMSHPLSAEKALRDLLRGREMPMEEAEIADEFGCSKAKVRERMEPLIRAKKVGSITRNRMRVYAWMEMDEHDEPAPTTAPRTSPAPNHATDVVSRRGEPVRIRTERKTRKSMSTPGARSKVKQANARYEKQQAAVEARAAAQRAKAAAKPRKKPLSAAAAARQAENKAKAEADKVRSSSRPARPKNG